VPHPPPPGDLLLAGVVRVLQHVLLHAQASVGRTQHVPHTPSTQNDRSRPCRPSYRNTHAPRVSKHNYMAGGAKCGQEANHELLSPQHRTWCITAVSKTTTKGAACPIGPQRMPQHVLRPAQQAVLASRGDSPHKAQGQGRADKWAGAVVTTVTRPRPIPVRRVARSPAPSVAISGPSPT
jgi:hypothetical protein